RTAEVRWALPSDRRIVVPKDCSFPLALVSAPRQSHYGGSKEGVLCSDANHVLVKLKRPRAEQEIDDVPFVRLEPVQLNGRNRTSVEPVNVDGVGETTLKFLVFGHCRAH